MRRIRSVVLDLCLWWSSAAFFAAPLATHSFAAASLTDSNAFEHAISQIQPGRTVNLPAGVFAITEPIKLPSGARLIGAGQDKTVLHYAGPNPGVMISLQHCEDVEVGHLTLDAQNNPIVQQGIVGADARRLKLHHLTIRNLAKGTGFGPHGILFAGINPTRSGGVTDSEVSDCLVEHIAPDAAFGCGIRFSWGSSRNRVLRNTIRETGRGGIFGDNGSTDLLIRSNTVSGSGGEGLGIEVWEACDRAVIEDNRLDHWLSIGGNDYCAVRRNAISDKSGVVKFIGLEAIGAHCIYTDNVVDDGQQIGFSVSNINPKDYAYWGYNTVLNCIQWAAQFQGEKSGIACHYFYRCQFNHTSSHRGKPIYPNDAGHGFRMNGNVRNCTFEECEFSDNDGYGLQFGGSGLDAFSFLRCAIRGNKGPAMVGLQDYHALEWKDCTISSNSDNALRPEKPFSAPAPVAAFKCPAQGRVGEPIRFVSDSRAAQGRIATVLWDFNDGPPVSEASPTHIYTEPGEYRITLIVWDDSGRASRAERRLKLTAARGLPPSTSPPPYPPSPSIESITWHWETYATAALGSDLWPVTWGPDDHLYAAWGDGGGFGGSDSDGRVALGIARIEGGPEHWRGVNVNGGKNPEHPASFPKKGKTDGVAFVDGVLYATVNLEDGTWPDVNHVLVWSTNKGATWTKADWLFPRGAGQFQPAKFLAFGRDYSEVPQPLAGYVYLYGPRQSSDRGSGNQLYLARVPRTRLRERGAYEFFQQADAARPPVWVADIARSQPVFVDPHGVTPGSVVYDPGLKRFLLTSFHVGPGQLGVFDAPNPWGPWTTVSYYEDWGSMGAEGEGLTCGFPPKWISADGLTLWSVFSVYGEGAKQGINAHDRFNLVKATLNTMVGDAAGQGSSGGRSPVRVIEHSFTDDSGPFLGLGVSYFQALRHAKYDRARLESNLSLLASKGFNYVRVLSMVSWDGLEIAPVSFTNRAGRVIQAWPDYWQQFRDLLDVVAQHGLRAEISIFADAQYVMPSQAARQAHLDGILASIAGREPHILYLEVANEAWQNGFPGAQGIADLRAFTRLLAERTAVPVAITSNDDTSDQGIIALYRGSYADLATVHFSRDTRTVEGGWLPVRDAYRAGDLPGVPPVVSNEPIGPGASVSSEDDPIKLCAAAAFAYLANLPAYVYHSRAGVQGFVRCCPPAGGEVRFEASAGINAYQHLRQILPPDLASWVRNDGLEPSAPFTVFCNGQPNRYWPDVSAPTNGCDRNIGSAKGRAFLCLPMGILHGGVTLEARRALQFQGFNPLSGVALTNLTLNEGDRFTLPQGPGAYILKGTFRSR